VLLYHHQKLEFFRAHKHFFRLYNSGKFKTAKNEKRNWPPLVMAADFFLAEAHLQKGHPQQPLD
jgi:hypothetical protein